MKQQIQKVNIVIAITVKVKQMKTVIPVSRLQVAAVQKRKGLLKMYPKTSVKYLCQERNTELIQIM